MNDFSQNNTIEIFEINENESNKRVDIALSNISNFSRSMIQKIILAQNLTCNEIIVTKANKKTQKGERYKIKPLESNFKRIIPEHYELDILFEDEHLIVVNKPADLVVHPGAGNYNNTLINKLAYHCKLSNINGPDKLGTVHRLDKGVSGCIIFAKDNFTHIKLNEQFALRKIKKTYIAFCHNYLHNSDNFVQNFIARSKINRKKMEIFKDQGKIAQMHFFIKKIFHKQNQIFSFIECQPITGRMHQIRLQLAHIKLPILNDKVYGIKESLDVKNLLQNRIALHSSKIEFFHPKSANIIKIESPLPIEFKNLIEIFT